MKTEKNHLTGPVCTVLCTGTCYIHVLLTVEALVTSLFKEVSSKGRLQ